MKRRQAYKFQLKTNGAPARQMRRIAGACRFIFNRALALQKERYSLGEKKLGYAGLCANLASWKDEAGLAWLREAPSQALQQVLKDLERAYANFFAKRADFPRLKKGQSECFRFPQGVTLDQANSRIKLPKLGWIRYRHSREVLGEIENVTVSQANGKWYVSIQTEREVDQPIPAASSAIGIAMGVARIANVRRDFLHQATNTLSKNHAVVFVEDLQVRNMSKSAAGTSDAPGRNVSAKSGLNQAILDQGWFEFRRQLEYKLAWNGGQLIAVPPHYTSQTCPCCGHVSQDNRQTQARFECVDCGFAEHADLVGAINIKAAGLAVFACGEAAQSGASMKQEPAEETTHAVA
jgi:putative transposase